MFELVKVFIERMLSILDIPKIIKFREDHRYASIGADLFILYASLNRIYVDGLRLAGSIEDTIQRAESVLARNNPDSTIHSGLRNQLDRQIDNLINAMAQFDHLSEVVQVVHKDSYEQLMSFINPKVGALTELRRAIHRRTNEVNLFFLSKEQID